MTSLGSDPMEADRGMTASLPDSDGRFARPAAIRDAHVLARIRATIGRIHFDELQERVIDQFLDRYTSWIAGTRFISNLDQFKVRCFSQGTTESFDKFYVKYRDRRIRYFSGEYLYHRINLRHTEGNGVISSEEPLREGDALILSVPFADNLHPYAGEFGTLQRLFSACDELRIPVLLDFAFLGTVRECEVDVSPRCIDTLAFSLSKTFPVGHCRIGMRLTRDAFDDGLSFYHAERYSSLIATTIGLDLLTRFDPWFMVERYDKAHRRLCSRLGLDPSTSILFAFGGEQYAAYRRGDLGNRLFVGREYSPAELGAVLLS
jgi:hypothetical protein